MKKQLIILLLMKAVVILILIQPNNIQAQDNQKNEWLSNHPMALAFGNNIHSLPFHNMFRTDPYYPSASMGTEFRLKEGRYGELIQLLNFGGFYHRYSARGIYLSTNTIWRFGIAYGFDSNLGIGLGYLHIFHPEAVYEYKSGEYEQVRDWGSARLMMDIILEIGYTYSGKSNKPVRFFIRYKPFLFLYREGLPAMNGCTQLGVNFYLNSFWR